MATYRLWPSTSGPASGASDIHTVDLGVQFYVTQPGCTFTGWYWWVAGSGMDTTASSYQFRLWSTTTGIAPSPTSPLAGPTTATAATAGQWNFTALATPVALAVGTTYVASVRYSTGSSTGYSATASGWTSSVTQTPLVAPNTTLAVGGAQGTYNEPSASPYFPANIAGTNYWLDVQITQAPAIPAAYAQPGQTWKRAFKHPQQSLPPPPPPAVAPPLDPYTSNYLPNYGPGPGPTVWQYAQPGQTWRCHFLHRQQPFPLPPPAVPAVQPVPLTSPIRAHLPVTSGAAGGASNQASGPAGRYGRTFSLEGVYSGTGPVVRSANSPANQVPSTVSAWKTVFSKGRISAGSHAGVFAGTGPNLTAQHTPARSRPATPSNRGRALVSKLAAAAVLAPVLIIGPVQAKHVPAAAGSAANQASGTISRYGRTFSLEGVYSGTGPAVRPLPGPVTVRRPPPVIAGAAANQSSSGAGRAGRVFSLEGVYSGTGPAVKPLFKPVATSLRLLPPHGIIHASRGAYSGTGPPIRAWQTPVRAPFPVVPPPARGRAYQTPRPALPVFIIGTAAATSSALTLPVTLTGSAGFGDAVIVGWGTGGTQTLASITDTGLNSWRIYNLNVLGRSCGFAVCQPVTARLAVGNTITLTWSSSQAGAAIVYDVPVGGRVYTDVVAGAGVSVGNTSPSVASGSLSQMNELLLGVIVNQSGGGSPTSPSWQTAAQQHAASQVWLTGYVLQPGAVTTSQTLSATIVSSLWGAGVLSLASQQTAPVSITLAHRPPVLRQFLPARAKTGPAGNVAGGPAVPASVLQAAWPARGPVQARLTASVSRGRAVARAGQFSGTGPPVRPGNSPANPVPTDVTGWRQPVIRGRVLVSKLTAAAVLAPAMVTGPVQAKHVPAAAGSAANQASGTISRYGRTFSLEGVYSGTGPAVTPLRGPVTARIRLLPPHGIVHGSAGVFSGTGPAVTALRAPARARLPVPVLRGRSTSLHGIYTGTGPAVTAWHQPARTRLPAPAVQGKRITLPGVFSGTGPAVIPVTAPRQATLPRLTRGRISTSRIPAAIPAVTAVALPHAPVRARFTAAAIRGTISARPGVFSGTGPQVTGLRVPVRGHVTAAGKGRTASSSIPPTLTAVTTHPLTVPVRAKLRAPAISGHGGRSSGSFSGTGPAVTALRAPVRARLPVPILRGRNGALAGVFSGTGPHVTPATGPARARLPLQPTLRGRSQSLHGIYSGTGPAVAAIRQPARAHLPVPVLRGRSQSLPGAYSGTGPAVTPQTAPVRARLPLQPVLRGRAGLLHGVYSGTGPAVTPLRRPVHAAIPARRSGHVTVIHAQPAAAIPVLPAPQYAQPGPAWLEHFRRRQLAYPLPAMPVSAVTLLPGPSFTPGLARPGLMTLGQPFSALIPGLWPGYPAQPVRARIRAAGIRGHGGRNTGVYSGTGPQVTLLRQPAASRRSGLLSHGRIQGHAGIYSGTGPAVTSLQAPVAAKQRLLPSRGRTVTRPGMLAVPLSPLSRQPVTSCRRPLVRGHVTGISRGLFSGTGPQLAPSHGPVHVRQVVAVRGHAGFKTLTAAAVVFPVPSVSRVTCARVQPGLVHGRVVRTAQPVPVPAAVLVRVWHGPIRAPAVTPVLAGRAAAVSGVYSGAGPVVTPWRSPVRAVLPLRPFRRGRGMGIVRAVAVPAPPAVALFPFVPGVAWPGQMTPGDPGIYGYAFVYPLAGPVRARLPLRPVLRGRCISTPPYVLPVQPVIPVFKAFFPFVPGLARPGLMAPGEPGITYPVPYLPPYPAGLSRRAPGPVLHGRIRSTTGRFSGTGPQVRPLTGPVHPRLPLQPVLRGRSQSIHGVYSGTGPQVTPLRTPVTTVRLPVFSRGQTRYRPGVYSGTGPQVTPLITPVRAHLPVPILRGRYTALPGVYSGTGPHVTPATSPARTRPAAVYSRGRSIITVPAAAAPQPRAAWHAPIRAPFPGTAARHGRAYAIAGRFSGTGPQVTPLITPVRAHLPVPVLRGRVAARAGVFSGTGPQVTLLRTPVRAYLPVPVLRGRYTALPGVYSGIGPVVHPPGSPANQVPPVTSNWRLTPVRGHAASTRPAPLPPTVTTAWHAPIQAKLTTVTRGHGSLHGPATLLGTGPAVTPLRQPVRAQFAIPVRHGRIQALPGKFSAAVSQVIPGHGPARAPIPGFILHGRAITRAGVYSGTGPQVRPLPGPVRPPRLPVFAKGRIQALPGVMSGTGTQLAPGRGPARASLPGPQLHGRAITRAGVYSGTGPQIRPLPGPVEARHPLPPQGRIIRHAGIYSGTGPPVTPLHTPVSVRRPQPTRTGRSSSLRGIYTSSGPVVRPQTGPVQARHPLPPPGRARSLAGTYSSQGPAVRPQTGPARSRILATFSKGRMFTTPPYVVPIHHDVIMSQAGGLRAAWQAAPPMTAWQTRPLELP